MLNLFRIRAALSNQQRLQRILVERVQIGQ
jgi:hypothetical protein